uniref:Uncharacterized protein n=1 Tax=Phlebotomus papatasi TaxID=29031 RepID=A0A1B0DDY3_PHLPP
MEIKREDQRGFGVPLSIKDDATTEEATDWLDDVDAAKEMYTWEDHRTVLYAAMQLRGAAKIWIWRLQNFNKYPHRALKRAPNTNVEATTRNSDHICTKGKEATLIRVKRIRKDNNLQRKVDIRSPTTRVFTTGEEKEERWDPENTRQSVSYATYATKKDTKQRSAGKHRGPMLKADRYEVSDTPVTQITQKPFCANYPADRIKKWVTEEDLEELNKIMDEEGEESNSYDEEEGSEDFIENNS